MFGSSQLKDLQNRCLDRASFAGRIRTTPSGHADPRADPLVVALIVLELVFQVSLYHSILISRPYFSCNLATCDCVPVPHWLDSA
jgi:hypothetical protein